MQYGFFDDATREYVITRPDTPRPWSNYIGSAEFGGVVTNNAAGYTFYKSAYQGRLTRYQFNVKPGELPGRYVYLRNNETGDYWSNSWMPVGKPMELQQTECRHGTGYTRITSEYDDIRSEVTYFSRPGDIFEVWRIDVTNTGDSEKSISIFPYIEPQCNWSAEDDNQNLQYNQYISTTTVKNGIIDIGSNVNMPTDASNFTNKDQARHTFYALSGIKPAAFDSDLNAFFGSYGTFARPRAVVEGKCSNSTAAGDMPCAAFQVDLRLEPGETSTFAVLFGVGDAAVAKRAVAATDTAEKLEVGLQQVKDHWHSRIETLHAETPDPYFNSMVNTWSAYNSLMTFYWSRVASLVYAGERDGLGYRDSVQDIVASSILVPDETRDRIELMLTGQFSHGGCKPVVQPFKHKPGFEIPPQHYRSDDGMWLFCAVPAFVKETGDIGFYRKVLPYADQGEASVFGHLKRAIEFNLNRLGAHGLPCGLHNDWNDCLRLGEKGESVFVALQLRHSLNQFIEISQLLGEKSEVEWATGQLRELDDNIEQFAWDGEWYLRAYRYDGLKFGSRECDEGRIFMNPQAWAVLSGHATGERAEKVMASMHEHLSTDFGLKLCTPAYVTTDPKVCLCRLFNPGMKENAGIFNHTQGWGIMAAAMLGMGDRAYDYLGKVLPASFNDRAEIRQVEPYVVCQSTHSSESPHYGSGRVSWLSGSAVWNYIAMVNYILGVHPGYDSLVIDPCIPSSWSGFKVKRRFRGAEYLIEVKNPHARCKGVQSLLINGERVAGNRVPVFEPGEKVNIVAEIE